jgi:ABC-2 type transport system ATP-binding protein
MSLIEFKNVTKVYQKDFWSKKLFAVNNLSFSVPEKSITGFVGPNGAGKTTSIKMAIGLVRPTSGSVSIRGISSHEPNARHKVAYVSEQPYFYHHLSVAESLAFTYKLNRFPNHKLAAECTRVLAAVQLQGNEQTRINTMSKGMQQRLNMAHALLGDPDIFIFDEPMSGLDPLGRRLFRDLFRTLAGQEKCVFFSTHILEDIESLCDFVVVLSRGSLHYAGNVADLLSKHTSGIEIDVPRLSADVAAALTSQGCEITYPANTRNSIFVPGSVNVQTCQNFLYTNKIFPYAIRPRTSSLESVLYAVEDKEPRS